jgi:hypothetical protein
MADGLQDPTSAVGRSIDNGRPGVASAIKPVEDGCQHLAGARKPWGGGSSRSWSIPQNVTTSCLWKVARTAFTKSATVHVIYRHIIPVGDVAIMTVFSSIETLNVKLSGTQSASEGYAERSLEIGLGDDSDFGTENLIIQFATSIVFGTLEVLYLGVEPLSMPAIEV